MKYYCVSDRPFSIPAVEQNTWREGGMQYGVPNHKDLKSED
jgi:hypothetical protein